MDMEVMYKYVLIAELGLDILAFILFIALGAVEKKNAERRKNNKGYFSLGEILIIIALVTVLILVLICACFRGDYWKWKRMGL